MSDHELLGLGDVSARAVFQCGHLDNCPNQAAFHLIITTTAENTTTCERHLDSALVSLAPLASHPIGPACGMPGSTYDWDANVCRDGFDAASVEAMAAEVAA